MCPDVRSHSIANGVLDAQFAVLLVGRCVDQVPAQFANVLYCAAVVFEAIGSEASHGEFTSVMRFPVKCFNMIKLYHKNNSPNLSSNHFPT